MRRALLAATAGIALLLWLRRRRGSTDFEADALEFLRTVVQPFDQGGHPDDRFP